ncbi:DUF421 domain-containing protein [Paenibacillus sp. TRM 82003]|nr:DUF421 domain-containing protein [Paenibacillus sp. TRM 82003]
MNVDITWHILWKSALIVLFGILALRLSGRRSISQMTAATTVIMISIGNILAQAIIEKAVWRAMATVALFLLVLVIVEWLEYKFGAMERLFAGRAVTVVTDGHIDRKELARLRLTEHQLEMRLRQQGIQRISDLQTVTVEVNGAIGFEYKRSKQPLTVGEFEKLIGEWLGKEKGTSAGRSSK